MAAWLDELRASVAWGDRIEAAYFPDHSIECSFIDVDGDRFYNVAGTYAQSIEAIAACSTIFELTGVQASILFVDEGLTADQVEELMVLTHRASVGCGFLKPSALIHQHQLLTRYTQGSLLEAALEVIAQQRAA